MTYMEIDILVRVCFSQESTNVSINVLTHGIDSKSLIRPKKKKKVLHSVNMDYLVLRNVRAKQFILKCATINNAILNANSIVWDELGSPRSHPSTPYHKHYVCINIYVNTSTQLQYIYIYIL